MFCNTCVVSASQAVLTAACRAAAALMALKKKKMYETQLEQVENNILRVNEQQMMLENQRTTVETVSALRNAAQASKATMSEMKINDVDQVRGQAQAALSCMHSFAEVVLYLQVSSVWIIMLLHREVEAGMSQ